VIDEENMTQGAYLYHGSDARADAGVLYKFGHVGKVHVHHELVEESFDFALNDKGIAGGGSRGVTSGGRSATQDLRYPTVLATLERCHRFEGGIRERGA
jgi:hypothetical protein